MFISARGFLGLKTLLGAWQTLHSVDSVDNVLSAFGTRRIEGRKDMPQMRLVTDLYAVVLGISDHNDLYITISQFFVGESLITKKKPLLLVSMVARRQSRLGSCNF